MKNKIFYAVLFTLVAVFALSGCDGCISQSELTVNGAFNNEVAPGANYQEVLTYSVDYNAEDYSVIDSTFKNNEDIKFEFTNGKYVSNFKVEKSFPDTITSNILDTLTDTQKHAYHLTTEFTINVKYSFKTAEGYKEYPFTDKITTEAYFCGQTLAYAPVYTKTTSEYTLLMHGSSVGLVRISSESQTKYDKDNYELTYTYKQLPTSADQSEGEPTTTVTKHDYKFKTLTDNTMLFFTIRNMGIKTDSTVGLPTVSPNYGEDKLLAVNNLDSKTEKFSFTYNGEDKEEDVALANHRFSINDQNASGALQYLFIQNKSESSTIPYKAIPFKYVEPIYAYGSFLPLGSLIYRITDISIYE